MGSRWSITSNLPSDREEVRRLTREAALRHGVNPDLLESQSFQESGFNRNALSSAGAEGSAQFMPKTGAAYGLRSSADRRDPVKAADAMARHMKDLLKRYNGDIDLSLIAYNAGPDVADRVRRGGGMPTETKKYIPAIKAHYDQLMKRGGFPDAPSAPKASIPDIAAPKREYKDTGWIDGRPGSADTQTRVESMRKPYEGPTDAPVASGFELKESVPKPSVATVRVPSVAEAARTRVARQPGRNYVAEGAKALDAFGNAVLGGWRRPDSSMDRYEHAERQQAAARSTRAVSGSRMAGVFAPKGNVRPRTPLGQLPGADLVETPADRAVAAVAPPQRREIGLNARERGIPAPLRANETRPDWQDQAEVPDALPANAMQPDWADSGMAAQRPGAAVGGVFGGGRTAPAEEPILAAQRRANIQPTDPELAARARRNAMYPELAPEGWTGPDYARKQREAAGWSRIKDIATGEQHPYAKLASILGEFTWTPPNLDAESRAINDRATDEQFDRSALGRIGQVGAFLSNPTAAVGVFSTDDAVRRIKENKYFEPAARSLGPLENVGRGLVNAPGQIFQGLSNNLVRSRQQVEANPNAAVPGAVDVIGHLANATGQAPAALGALMLGGPIAAELGGGEGLAGAIGLGGLEAASGRPYGAQQAETPDEYLGRVARAATTGGIFPYATKALAPVVNPLVRGGEAAISKLGRFGQLIEPLAIPSRLGSGASMAAVGPVTAGLFGDPMPTVGQTVENVATGIATVPEANRFRGVHPTLHPTDWATQAKEAVQANRKALAVSRLAPDSKITFADDLFVESGGLRGSRHIGTIEGTTGGLDPIVTVRLGSGRSQQFNLQDLVRRGVEPGANPDVIMEGTIAANLELERARATSEQIAPDPIVPTAEAPTPAPALDADELMRTEQQRAEAESRRAAERDAARAARTPVEPQRTAGDARTYLVRDEDGRHAMVTVKGDQIVRADEVTNPKRSERYQTESAVEVSRDEMDGLVRPDQFVDAGEAHRTQFVRDYDLARPLRGAAKETAPVVDVAGSTAAKQAAPTPNDVKRETLKPESITAGVESGNLVPYRDTQYLTDAPDVAARRNQTRLIDPQTNERLTFASPEAAEAFVNPSIVPRETVVSPVEGSAAAPSTVPSEVPQPIAPQTAASGEAGATVPASSIVNPDGTVTRTFTDQRKDPATRNMVTALYSDEQLRAMTHDELIETIKRIQIEQRMHELTGIQNKIAYNEAVKKKVQTSIDLAGLKRANDTVNPEFGDIILTGAAELLVKHAGKDAFHVKGDEYIAQFNSKKEANKVMEAFRKELFESIFEYTMPNGKVRRFTGVDLYYEHGKTIVEADFKLNAAKDQRKLDATGRTPGRLVELPPTRRNVPDGETGRPGLSGSEDGAGSGADGSAGSARRNNVEPREGAGPVIRGRSGEIRIPGTTERVPFTYVIRDAGDVHASHTGLGVESGTFEYENDRRYDKPEDRARIENQARNYDTEQAHTDNPTPEVGPAIIDPRGNVLGGNSREMTTKRVYELHPENAAALRRSLAERAETFGIPADEIASMDSMKRPQLYREIDPEYFATADPQKLIRDFNAPSTAKLTSGERAMSLARNVTPEALALISTKIGKHGEDGSVAQALSSDGPEIINKLIADGLITNQDRPELFGEDGAVNEKGRALVRDILIGKMFRDGDQLAMTQSGLKGKLERISSRYQRVENDPALAGFHIGDTLHDAIDLLNEAHARGTNRLELVYGQKSLLEAPRFSDDAIALARVLQQGPVNAAKAINGYYTEAIRSLPDTPGDLFGTFPATPDQARAEFLQGGENGENGPLAMAEDVARRVPSTLADHDLVVQGDKVLDVVPKGTDLKSWTEIDTSVGVEEAPEMSNLLKAGQMARLEAPVGGDDAPIVYVNAQTADTLQSLMDGKKSDWAGLSMTSTEIAGVARKLRDIADSGTLPSAQAFRARGLADTLEAAAAAAKNSPAVSVVKTEVRNSDGTLRPRPLAFIKTVIAHEQHHAVQKILSRAWTSGASDRNYIDPQFVHDVPGLEPVLARLKESALYSKADDGTLAMEVFTHLSTSPDVSVLGVNRKQATELLRHFYDAVYDRYGREGVERFVKINEEAQGVRDEILTGQDTGKGERADARERQRASRGVSEGEGTGRNGSVREGGSGDGGPLAAAESVGGPKEDLSPAALKAKYFGTGQEREGAKSYGREATSFGRSSAKAKRIEPAKLEGGEVKPLKQIISDFADSIDRVIAKTKQKPKFLGTYWPRDTHIGIRNAGDLDTVAHEGAHALDDMHGIVAEWAYDENSPFDKELIPQFSQHGSRPPAGMDDVEARAYERAEGVAEWVRAYIMNPEAALTAAPKFAKFFTLKIPAEQHAAVRAFSKDVREFAGLRADKAIGANIRMDIPRQTFWKKLGLGDDWQATLSRELSDELAPAIAKWREVRGFRGLGAATPRADFERLARVLSGHDEKMEDIFANGIVDALNPVSRDKNGRVTVNRTTDGGIDWILAPADTTSRETVRSDMAAMARLTVAERQIGETDVLMEAAAKKADELAEKFGAKVQAKLDAEAKLREKAIEKTYNGRLRDAEKAREKALAKATTDKEKQKAVDLANRRIDEAAKRYEADRTKHAEWLSKAEAEMQTRVEEFADRASKRGEERAWNRAARLSGIGGGLKHDTEHAREAIEALKTEDPEQYARVSEMAARFRQTADAVLQYLDDMGRYSTEEIERFRQKKDYYTPFARVLGEDTPDTRAIGGGGKHLTSPAQLMKRFKGGTDQIENPFVSLLDKMYRSIKEADRNAVMEAFVSPMRLEREMYQGPPINTAQFGYRVEAPQEGSVKIFHKTVDDQGVATVETEHWMFPEETRASLKGLGEVGDMGFVWKFVTAPARMTRWGVVHAPGFLIRNIIRDPFVRIVHTNVNSHLRDSFVKFTGGEKSAFRIGGGGQAGLVETAKSDYDAMIEGAIDKLREDKKSVVLRPSQVWGVYKNLIRASEEQGRLAEFRKAYDHAEKVLGLDSRDATIYAASEARGLMDYAIAGRSIRRLTQLIPFVNPQVQGLKKTVNSLTTPGKRGGAAAKMMAYSIIPEIAAYVLNASQGEDVEEEYWQQPSYLRDTFWNVKIADDLWLRIPKPFELGLPASAVGRAIAAMRGDPHAMEGFGGVAFRMLAPVDPESLLTGGAGGVAGALLNRDIFRDQYVVDPNEEKLEIPLRKGTKNASRIGQLIQQASMDTIDSRQVDFIARSQFGGVGTLATQLSDIGREDRGRAGRQAAMTAGGLFAQSPATAARDVQFVLTTAEKKNESNSDLVEKLRDVKKAYNEATTREDRDRLAETMRQVAAEARQFYDANGSFLTEREQKSRDRNRGIREVREERRKQKLLSDYGVDEE